MDLARRIGVLGAALMATVLGVRSALAQDAAGASGVVTEPASPPHPSAEEAAAAPQASEPSRHEAAQPSSSPPSAHVGELARRTRSALQRARPLLRRDDEIARLERRIAAAEAEVARLTDPARLARIPTLAPREIADLRQDWRRRSEQYERWRQQLEEKASELESVRAELADLRRRWAELRRHARTSGGPEKRQQRIATSLEAVRAADDQIETQLDGVLALQERVSELSIAAEDVGEQLRSAAHAYRERLFVRDRPPIWRGLGGEGSLLAQARASWQRWVASVPALAAHRAALGWQALLFFALSALMLWLARRGRTWPADDETLARARIVVQRPFATALLASLMSTPLVVRHAPILLYDVAFFLLSVPLARVLPPLAPAPVRPLLYFVAGFLVVNRIEVMLAQQDGLARVLLLAESAIASPVFAAWALGRRGERDGRVRAHVALAHVAASVLGAALLANAFGYVFFAGMLVRGTGASLYAGLALTTACLVADGLLAVAIRSAGARRLRAIADHGPLVHRRVLGALGIGALLGWAWATLGAFGMAQIVERAVTSALARTWTFGTLDISLAEILLALAILGATWIVARVVLFFLELDVLPRCKLEPGVDGAIAGLTRYLIGAAGLLLALAALGIDASHIALVAGALGVGVGFGLQGIVANFIAGIVLMLERPVRLGDFIEVGPLVGRVERIGLRSSTVRSLDGAEVIVPNESLISREVVNWTLSDRKRRITVRVGVAYGADPKRVLAILERVAAAHSGVLPGPAPEATFEGFGESSLDFAIQFWTDDFADARRLQSAIGIAVHDALAEAGIEIPFPQRVVHLRERAACAAHEGRPSNPSV